MSITIKMIFPFPVELAFGGMLGPDAAASHTINIPENVVAGSITHCRGYRMDWKGRFTLLAK